MAIESTRRYVSDASTLSEPTLRRFEAPIRFEVLQASARTRTFSAIQTATTVGRVPEVAQPIIVILNFLAGRRLRRPLSVIVEADNESYIARTPDLPLYGIGDDPIGAIQAINREISSLYEDLQQDDNFTNEWLQVKTFLRDNLI